MKHSSGSANGVARRYDVATDDSSIADQRTRRARRPDLSVELADEANDQETGFWYSVLDFLMEGFALCATSSYPTMFPPLAPHPEQQKTPTAREISLRRWRSARHGPLLPDGDAAGLNLATMARELLLRRVGKPYANREIGAPGWERRNQKRGRLAAASKRSPTFTWKVQ